MIRNIIFGFEAVLIPIDEQRMWQAFRSLRALKTLREQKEIFVDYETGKTDNAVFLTRIKPFFFRKRIFSGDLKNAWNETVHSPIPELSITLLKQLEKDYSLFLISNTNELNIRKIRENTGPFLFKQFQKPFTKIYLSYETGLLKSDEKFFKQILEENELIPEETFFVDGSDRSIKAAEKLGIHTWHFIPEEDSILNLKEILSKIQNSPKLL